MVNTSRIFVQLGCFAVHASALLMDSANQVHESSSAGGVCDLSDLVQKYGFMRQADGTINVNARDRSFYNETAVLKASANGDMEDVRLLLANDANLNEKDNYDYTPLHWASCSGDDDEVVRLLLANGANVNAKSHMDGVAPLHFASACGQLAVIHVLVANGADLLAQNDEGQTPLELARGERNKNVIAVLEHYENHKPSAQAWAVVTGTKWQDGSPVLDNKKTKALVPGHKNVNNVVLSFLRPKFSK